jgi:hypothetical protein
MLFARKWMGSRELQVDDVEGGSRLDEARTEK